MPVIVLSRKSQFANAPQTKTNSIIPFQFHYQAVKTYSPSPFPSTISYMASHSPWYFMLQNQLQCHIFETRAYRAATQHQLRSTQVAANGMQDKREGYFTRCP